MYGTRRAPYKSMIPHTCHAIQRYYVIFRLSTVTLLLFKEGMDLKAVKQRFWQLVMEEEDVSASKAAKLEVPNVRAKASTLTIIDEAGFNISMKRE